MAIQSEHILRIKIISKTNNFVYFLFKKSRSRYRLLFNRQVHRSGCHKSVLNLKYGRLLVVKLFIYCIKNINPFSVYKKMIF